MTLHVGVTGSRLGGDRDQNLLLGIRLAELFEQGAVFHHGSATGVDAYAHNVAKNIGYRVVVHPPKNPRFREYVERLPTWVRDHDVLLPEAEYMVRNLDIVNAVSTLIAVPSGTAEEQVRSGTWATYRMAVRLGVQTTLIPRT